MRTREEIHADIHDKLQVQKWDGKAVRESALIEISLDCRDLLQKLVERKERTKVISTEVPFTEKENELFNGLDKLDV